MDFSGITDSKTLFTTAMQKQAANAAASAGSVNMKKVKKAAQDFEAFFVGSMMESMTSEMQPDEVFGGGHGEEMWRSMLNQEYGKEVAKGGKLGLSSSVMTAMLKMQEERTKAQQAAQTTPADAPAAPALDPNDPAAYKPLQAAAAAFLPVTADTTTFRPLKGK
jgi:Rod binding domain-containing protein